MLHPAYKIGMTVVLLGLLLNATSGQKEGPRPVRDEANLFSEKAIEEANAIAAKIKEKHRKDLVVETKEKGVPAKEARKWATDRLKSLGLDGVYIVITKEPRLFEVIAAKKSVDSGLFKADDVAVLVTILKTNLGKNRDEALLKAANYTLDAMNKRTTVKPGSDFNSLIGEWLGPQVEVTSKAKKEPADAKAKAQLYLRFSEVRGKKLVDLGYVRGDEGVFRNCLFELKKTGNDRQIVIRNGNDDGTIVLTYDELADDVRKITSSAKAAVPDVVAPVDLTGEWSRRGAK